MSGNQKIRDQAKGAMERAKRAKLELQTDQRRAEQARFELDSELDQLSFDMPTYSNDLRQNYVAESRTIWDHIRNCGLCGPCFGGGGGGGGGGETYSTIPDSIAL
jgi:hypothetical protein